MALSTKAAGRANPQQTVNTPAVSKREDAGNVERNQNQSPRTVAVPTSKYEVGPFLKVRSNDKGTNKLKVESSIALRDRRRSLPVSGNPDGVENRPATKVAAKSKQ